MSPGYGARINRMRNPIIVSATATERLLRAWYREAAAAAYYASTTSDHDARRTLNQQWHDHRKKLGLPFKPAPVSA